MQSVSFRVGMVCLAAALPVACSDASTNAPAGDGSADAIGDGAPGASSESSADASADATVDAAADGSGSVNAGEGGANADAHVPAGSPYIVVDQFGYRTGAEKIAVIRNPKAGFDSTMPFTPGTTYALVNALSQQKVLEAAPAQWHSGTTDTSSGDQAWWFDFSSVTAAGSYYVLDETTRAASAGFKIGDDVYRDVLKQALRMFYYQRDGVAKPAQYAGASWTDTTAHPQNTTCGIYGDGGSAPKDLHGGWFDAGDENKYAAFAAKNIVTLLRAYADSPGAFRDDYGIPESGNAVPDVLDEIKWGLDWLLRMQSGDGSVLSIVANMGTTTSPPSADTSPCMYGSASTSVTLSAAAAFAYASKVFGSVTAAGTAYPGYAASLSNAAQSAWTWAAANPAVTFFNVTNNLGYREQEVDAAGRLALRVQAATFLFELTGNSSYAAVVDTNYAALQTALDPYRTWPTETLLEYSVLPGATAATVQSITNTFKSAVEGAGFFGASEPSQDPYLAYIQTYKLGSNAAKAGQGNLLHDVATFGVDASSQAAAIRYAERYVHYVHGVNPMGLVYLSNMGASGAGRSVSTLFAGWFFPGTAWSNMPPPGFLVPGPNPGYAWESCCPNSCGVTCGGSTAPAPPAGQPDQKSYKDFNDAWPLDSWLVEEPDDAYQAEYVRLLAKFTH